jgi:hypothetical protein
VRPSRSYEKGLVFQYSAGSCNICYRPVSAFNKISTLLIIRGIIFVFPTLIFIYLSTVSKNVVLPRSVLFVHLNIVSSSLST